MRDRDPVASARTSAPAAAETDGSAPAGPVIPGAPTATPRDRITVSFVGGSTSVRPDATLQINLFDDHGIMTTGHAPQNSIIVTVDENTTSRSDVTLTFRYAADSYQSGTASFQLPGLGPGPHRISVSAADNSPPASRPTSTGVGHDRLPG
jgi:hypothetical protein